MARPRNLLAIFNPTAGPRRRHRFHHAMAVFGDRGALVRVHETTAPRDAEVVARAAEGFDAVVAAGGDGTINEVVNGLMAHAGRPPPLGILPLGTANVLAAELGLPMDPAAAAGIILDGGSTDIHLGLANGRHFSLMAGVGFDAHVVAGLDSGLKRRIGKGAYVWETARQLAAGPAARYRVTVDGRPFEAASAVIANSHYYGGRFVLAPDATPLRSGFEICLFERGGRPATVGYMAAMALGLLPRFKGYQVIGGRSVTVEGPAGEPVQTDGDIVATLPLTVTVADRRLPVFASAPGHHHALDHDGR
ncbi:diacylglycerol kinase family protein [Inquilinus sp. CAU 1745]|uniref:diacylglycerol/lipid kinase family protein n=1 Tax=Inquilinus sp. CAU 1745 TaxID=3140369 RepID=UPI00325B3954